MRLLLTSQCLKVTVNEGKSDERRNKLGAFINYATRCILKEIDSTRDSTHSFAVAAHFCKLGSNAIICFSFLPSSQLCIIFGLVLY